MPDTPDLPPPPEQPMPDLARASIRRQLAAATAGDDIGHGSRGVAVRWGHWTTPAIAAAAVVAVVLGAFAVRATQDNSSGPGRGSLQPAATSTDASGAPPPPKTVQPGPTPGLVELPARAVSCDDEVKEFARWHGSSLDGATVTAERDISIGTIYLYETKTAWVVCDDSTAVAGGRRSERGYTPTLLSFHKKSQDYPPNEWDISQNYIAHPDGGYRYFLAAGRDLDGMAIWYKFPDGHTEKAVVGENGLWSMAYAPTDGPLADPRTNVTELDPIKVTVRNSYDDYSVEFLKWGLDTCAQLNHGC